MVTYRVGNTGIHYINIIIIGIRLSLLTTSKLKEIDVIGWTSSLHASWALRIQGIFMMKLSTATKMGFLEIWHLLGSF